MLSKSTQYAIRALVYIKLKNCQNKRPGVTEIAQEIEAPQPYAGKILQNLTKNKLVDSVKGRGGGFFFNDQQSGITLLQVIKAMEGDALFHNCGYGLKNCNEQNPCPLHNKYKYIRDGYLEIVKTETIDTLAEKIKKGEAVLNRVL